jgi:hypothetical protein
MIGVILSAVSNGLQLANKLASWAKQNSDQNTGKQLQAAADAQTTIQEAQDGQKIDAAVGDQSRDQLIADLVQQQPPAGKR